jgi:class 3 adenylate cyclase/tetratricopeptide (TPR) repeat protein
LDIGTWLRDLGLERYAGAFRANEVDWKALPKLTAQDLEELGVVLGSHRRRLLEAVAALPSRSDPQRPSGSEIAAAAERRQLTVMFCDLADSTALSARLDPEDLREVIAAYHGTVAQVVAGFDGFVAKYMGDGVLAYFGYPQAHEDDAERAVRAGLGLIEAVGRLRVKSIDLQTRVGIATGLVVVGDLIGQGAAQEQAVVGETPNLAARLQALAEPDAVVIAAGTRRLIGDLFEYRDLGTVGVKGIAAPMPAWRVLRPSAVASRFEALRGAALSRLVGRDEEIELLLRRWVRAKAGEGQAVLVSGEPGIGKSRLVAALGERLQSEAHFRLRYFCSPYHRDSALYPFIDQLGRAAGFGPDDPPFARLEKLEALLARAAPLDEDVAFLADLLSLPGSQRHPMPNLSSQRKKERTLAALIRQLEALSRRQPVLMVVEDAHWIDPTSRELLDLALDRVRRLPVLLVVTFRPEFQPPWTGQPQVSVVVLNRLDRHDRTALMGQVAGGKALPGEVVERITERTDGVPLFIEELTKSVLESGLLRLERDRYLVDGDLPPLAIPATLHDSLMARLDRLASVRLVAQTGAAIGREFSYSLLRAVSRLPEEELRSAVGRLVAAELVFQRGTPPDAVYMFKHALVQDAAHGSLLRSARQQLHAQIAAALEARSPELTDSQPELFAQHYAEAGLTEKSVAYWIKAGRRSAARSAMAESAAQFQRGLDQLALLPDGAARQRQELEIRSDLGGVLQVVKGHAAPETGTTYTRARALWERLGFPAEFVHVPYGQSRYHAFRGELDEALRLAEDLLRLSRQRDDSSGLVLGHQACGAALFVAGRFASSRSHLEEVLKLYDPAAHGSLLHQIGFEPRVISRGYLGFDALCLGFPDQAFALGTAALAEARALAHLPSLAGSLNQQCLLLFVEGDNATLRERANQAVAVATEEGFPFFRAFGPIWRGWFKVKDGNSMEGISLIRDGVGAYRATGAETGLLHYVAAIACEIPGQIEEAVTAIDDALLSIERTGERWFAAELHRQKGELLRRQGQVAAAEELFCQALRIAREQEAKLWELRAAVSLARRRRDWGRRAEARDLLAPVYRWFTEGFDTPDLKEAKALLDALQ